MIHRFFSIFVFFITCHAKALAICFVHPVHVYLDNDKNKQRDSNKSNKYEHWQLAIALTASMTKKTTPTPNARPHKERK